MIADLPTAAVYLVAIGALFLVAGAVAHLLEWWDTRGEVPGLTGAQLADRGVPRWPLDQPAPPFPYDLASWEDLGHRPDGEVVR